MKKTKGWIATWASEKSPLLDSPSLFVHEPNFFYFHWLPHVSYINPTKRDSVWALSMTF